jgi:hypothetical protein
VEQSGYDARRSSLTRHIMGRDIGSKQQQMRTRIAAAAARLMAEDGIEDYAAAKRKAARSLGATDTHALPSNDEIEVALRSYQALYQPDEQRDRIDALRSIALEVMEMLASFRPYLSGSVLKGTAGRFADIDLQIFPESTKEVELYLLNHGIEYKAEDQRHYCGDEPRDVSVVRFEWDETPIALAIYAARDERSNLKTSVSGRPIERAGIAAVRALVSAEASDAP